MGTRGRKSKVDLAVVPVKVTDRPAPAAGLNKEQTFEWLLIVNEAPADQYSTEQLPLLEAYCRHRVALRHVGALIDQEEKQESLNIPLYDKLLKMQERESRTLASLAVRLGFAVTTKGLGSAEKGKTQKPWE